MVLRFSLPADYGAGFEPSCVVSQGSHPQQNARAELAAVLSGDRQRHAGVAQAIHSGTDDPEAPALGGPGYGAGAFCTIPSSVE